MEPVPETREVLQRLTEQGDLGVADRLERLGRLAREIVPECVGLSVALLRDGLTFTLAATTEEIAALDAVQYLDGGPCLDAAHEDRATSAQTGSPGPEVEWHLFTRASAAAGVASTLTLPIEEEGEVVGSINLYASTRDAFVDHHAELAASLGASAHHVTSNADLSFATRLEAATAPQRLVERDDIDLAVGIIEVGQQVSAAMARERLRQAAARAGITDVQAARAVRGLLGP